MNNFFRHFFGFFILLGFLLIMSLSVSGAALSPSLDNMVSNNTFSDSLISVVIFLDNNYGAEGARKASLMSNLSFKVRHSMAIEALRDNHQAVTGRVSDQILDIYPAANIKSFWIAPVLSLKIPAAKLMEISNLSDIIAVYEDGQLESIKPVDLGFQTAKTSSIGSHLEQLNVPALWNRGYTGEGRLVCSFDTGVDGAHPALQSKWRGNHASSSASWFAPSSGDTYPNDATGHGSHTMGLMVGSTDTMSIGVAPDAEWIGAAVIDQGETLSQTFSDIIAAFQWAVDPDGNPNTIDDVPDVILNSWGVPITIMEPCDETFYQVIDNAESAGIVTIFAAGNEGPEPQSLRIPANRASSPFNSFSVGAIDGATNEVASFSSRGPSSCSPDQKKPEVVAPGVGLYSCAKGGGYIYKNGTSMAAPLIAGLVVLLRQYNPDATVNEIKNAIIMSCRDLGSYGEDNEYGYGLPDADVILQYMPEPVIGDFVVSHQFIGDDGIAEAGETFDLYIGLVKPQVAIDSVTSILECNTEGVSILNSTSTFIFENKSEYSISTNPFVINFASELTNGRLIPMNLRIITPSNEEVDTLNLTLMVGQPLAGSMVTHDNADIKFTVTDFGQYGLGGNSVFFAGGDGFKYKNSDNLLYESGIIIGRNTLQLSSSIRDSLGNAFDSDFNPVEQLSTDYSYSDNSFSSYAKFTDAGSNIPIPISVSQEITSYDQPGDEGFLIMKYNLINSGNENLTGMYFGLFNDFDLDSLGDYAGYRAESGLIFQYSNGYYVGLKALSNFNGLTAFENGSDKQSFSNIDKYNMISSSGISIDSGYSVDMMMLASFGPYNISARDSIEIVIVLAAAGNLGELEYSVNRAAEKYLGPTDIDDDIAILPDDFMLNQNYPNPFNPSTTISFSIPRSTIANLAVFNILGQEVKTLFNDIAQVGEHRIVWDGTDNNDRQVASGVYFYKLTTDTHSQSRKMIMIQ